MNQIFSPAAYLRASCSFKVLKLELTSPIVSETTCLSESLRKGRLGIRNEVPGLSSFLVVSGSFFALFPSVTSGLTDVFDSLVDVVECGLSLCDLVVDAI